MNFFKLNRIEIFTLLFLMFCLIWQIGTYPGWFDHIVGIALWPQINHVLDQAPPINSGFEAWKWQDMYQHNAGLSPTYGSLAEFGIRSFGFNLLGVRLPQTLLSIPVLFLAYLVLRQSTTPLFALTFTALIGSSPWFLVMIRSGGIIGFGSINLILTLTLIALLYQKPFNNKTMLLIALSAGVAVALLPYAHTSTRIFFIILAIAVPASFKQIGAINTYAFLFTLLLITSIQLIDINNASSVFFKARGEGLLQVAANQQDISQLAFIAEKLKENLFTLTKLLFNLNPSESSWINSNLANSYWNPSINLYPKYLTPFFALGFLASIVKIIKTRSIKHILLASFFIITCIPSLMSGIGHPNQARLFFSIFPIYIYITIGIGFTYEKILKRFNNGNKVAVTILSLVILAQTYNFFAFEKGGMDEKFTYKGLMESYFSIKLQCPDALYILHEYPEFNIYSYATIRWRGGDDLEQKIKQKQVWLFNNSNIHDIQDAIKKAKSVVIISHPGSIDNLSTLGNNLPEKINATGDFVVYSKNCSIQ